MRIGSVLLGLLVLTPIAFAFGEETGEEAVPPEPSLSQPKGENVGPIPTLLIVEVLPHAPRDNEYVVLANPGAETVNGSGWTLTDGEGSWTLPSVPVAARSVIRVTRNGTALQQDSGLRADACVVGCDKPLATRGSLALRNGGDGLQLLDPEGRLRDAFRYGESPALTGWTGDPLDGLAKGHVARRHRGAEGWLDTNTSTDWTWNRTFRFGQSRRPPASFDDATVKPLLSPEDSLESLLALLGSARNRIEMAGFTLTNPALGEALQHALGRGVRVEIGMEASPPGGMQPEGEQILEDLHRAGARVLLMGSHGEGGWRRYALHHAKYVMVDETWLVLGSENFSSRGFPAGSGNRGWSVAVHDPALTGWFGGVWREDWDENRTDVRSLPGTAGLRKDVPRFGIPQDPPSLVAKVTAFLAPDNAATEEGLLRILRGARERVDVELFYLRWWWGDSQNPFVAELLEGADRGVAIRILLDGQPYNVAEEEDNDEAVRRLNQIAEERGVPLEARIFPGDAQGIVKLHNKGLIVDGERVWVSSMNWNRAGAYANREAALLMDSPELAGVFQRAFQEDWEQGLPLGMSSQPAGLRSDLLLWIGLGSGAAAGAWWWTLRTTKEPTNKHRRKAGTWRRRFKRICSRFRRRRSRSTRTAR